MQKKIISLTVSTVILLAIGLQNIFANTQANLLITEVGNHEISDLEWVEIYNNSPNSINLNGLIFKEDNINHKTTLMQGSNILEPDQYALIVNKYDLFITKYPEVMSNSYTVLDSSWQVLSNQGELLELIIDSIVYESITYSENNGKTSIQRDQINGTYQNSWSPHYQDHSMFKLTEYKNSDNDQNTTPENSSIIMEDDEADDDNDEETELIEDQASNNTQQDTNDDWTEELEEDSDIPEIISNNIDIEEQNEEPNVIYKEIITYIEKPFIIISEVSFSSTPDWIEIFIDPRKNEVNLNNLELEIDKKFINLGLNGKINKPAILIAETNLVATTEQVSIIYNGQEYDSVCWNNGSPPLSEEIEETILKNNEYWFGDCLDSTLIKKDYTFSRKTLLPKNSKATDFILTPNHSKGIIELKPNQSPVAKISIKSGKTTGKSPLSITLEGSKSFDPDNDSLTYEWDFSGTKINKQNPGLYKFEKSGEHTVTLTVQDTYGAQSQSSMMIYVEPTSTTNTSNSTTQNTSNETTNLTVALTSDSIKQETIHNPAIELYSFLPNPKGADAGKEWIEIVNFDTKEVNLKNYYLDDDEGGSKPYHLEKYTLKAKESVKIFDSESKIILNNNKDKVRLIFGQQVVEEVFYENATDDEVFIKEFGFWVRKKENPINNQAETESKTTTTETPSLPIQTKTANISSTQNANSKNGDKSMNIYISEVFPNPKGADKGKEWIELKSNEPKNINLNNWKLKINNKEYLIENKTIKAHGFLVLQNEKMSIPNQNTEITLYDFEGKNPISKFTFDKSKEDHSAIMLNQDIYWTTDITPGKENPNLIKIEGTIEDINKTNQTIKINDKSIFFEKNFLKDLELAFKNKSLIKVQVWQNANKYNLESIIQINKTKNDEQKSQNKLKYLWTLLIPAIILIIYLKKYKQI